MESLRDNYIYKPCIWLFLCFFQPGRFRVIFEHLGFSQRVLVMFRLAFPLFLFSFLPALPVQWFLSNCVQSCMPLHRFPLSFTILASIFLATLSGVVCGLIVGMLGDVGLGILLALALGTTGFAAVPLSGAFAKSIAVALVLGLIAGNGRGFQWGLVPGVMGGILCGLFWILLSLFAEGIATDMIRGTEIAGIFLVSYVVGYSRILLYCVSGPSWFRASLVGKQDPSGICDALHTSSLYWDECIFLPLPHLRQTLLAAAGQDIQQALKEIAFIIDYRPQQQQAALVASFEIALRDMERRETLRDIANASQRLAEILSPQIRYLAPELMKPFNCLDEASREATRYHGPLNWHMRREALEKVITGLDTIYPETAFLDVHFTALLKNTIKEWRRAALYQLEKLEQGVEDVGQIINPYNTSSTFTQNETPFVGRNDMVRQLSVSLSKPNRPTFLLHGERRMGKSSLLRRLSTLLGASYIPVFCDLQNPAFSSSIDVFLGRLAEQIYQEVRFRGVHIEKIERLRLQEAFSRNEAAVYHPFDEWLDAVERILQQEKRTILLLFDEFEKLEEADEAQRLQLNVLLDWFRNTTQNRSHIAFLFCGVRTFGEMGTNWAGYFVNAKMLKISFLRVTEARLLITQPIPSFPSQKLFGEGVVEEIIHITGCHPFLIQAVCSELIDHLNLENRERAEVEDVAIAVLNVLNAWDAYFRDVWERTNLQQRLCLKLLRGQEERKTAHVIQQSGFDEQTVHQILQALLKRDLIRLESNSYRIATPIFEKWLDMTYT